jgi:accessory secretory protein Asp2
MARKANLIHFGSPIAGLEAGLAANFIYQNIAVTDPDQPIEIEDQPLIKDGELNWAFRHHLFLITDADQLSPALLRQLPANAMIFDQQVTLTVDQTAALDMKNEQWVRFETGKDLARQLTEYFFSGQLGYKLSYDHLQFNPEFFGKVSQLGHNEVEISDEGYDEFQPVMKWRDALPIAPNTQWEIRLEHARLDPDTELKLRVALITPEDERIYFTQEILNDNLNQPITITVQPQGGYLTAELFAKGATVHFKVGQVRAWQARNGHGKLLVGEHDIIDDINLNEPIQYYFDPGDFKPPLNVYFSGFRPAEGVEGVFMMRDLQAPSLIFGDQRILGGSFYIGSPKLEAAIVKVVQATLAKLGFESHQLILSGLSMGTYGALYYSSLLQPDWVVVGKPLTNLGDIAANERINRPDDFPTSLDVLLRLTGGVEAEHVEAANEIFWKMFRAHDHSKTNFVVAYMKNDDYDINAFENLTEYLHQWAPNSRIIHKGLIGRHNDATGELAEWFIRQYRNILTTEYGRDFETQEEP